MDAMEPRQAAVVGPEEVARTVATPLEPIEVVAAQYTVIHALHGAYYVNQGSLMSTSQPPEQQPTNPWDGKALLFRTRNEQLRDQVYVRPADGSLAESALRSGPPGSIGSRYQLAALVSPPFADGTDYVGSSDQFAQGPVCLETDQALIDQACAKFGVDIPVPARGADSLVIKPIDFTKPDAPVLVGNSPVPGPTGGSSLPPATGGTSDGPRQITADPSVSGATITAGTGTTATASIPGAVTIPAEKQSEVRSWLRKIEQDAIRQAHTVESDVGKAWSKLKTLLGHVL